MAMIQGIDGGALLQAFRAGREDRYVKGKRDLEMREAEAERARREQVTGLVGQLFGAPESGGVAAQYGAPETSAPQTFGEAFTPEGIEAAGPPQAPQALPAQQPPGRQPNPDVLSQLIVLDPETGGRIATALKTMDEMDIQRFETRNNFMGGAAQYVAQGRTPEERVQRFQIAAPQLLDAGWTPEELDGIDNDLSDMRLQGYMGLALDYDKFIDNELAEREFNAGKTVPVTAGGSVALVRPDGSAEYVIGGGGGSSTPPVRVTSIEEAQALPPGTEFIDPNGVKRIVPGGPTGSAPSAPFPG